MRPLKPNPSYKLAVVPKIGRFVEYSSAYGSQYDHRHVKRCLKVATHDSLIDFSIVSEDRFFRTFNKFDGVFFLGVSSNALKFLSGSHNIDLFVWAFNQRTWTNSPETFGSVRIVFEQFANDLSSYQGLIPGSVIYTPLGFQSDRRNRRSSNPRFDIVFNGTLDRSRRSTAKLHRQEILLGLLERGFSVLNYNGRAKSSVERELLRPLKRHRNFKVINKFGEPSHYSHGRYSLNLPFHELGSTNTTPSEWGMPITELEHGNWLIHWDLFRNIGARSNLITFDCPQTRALGLSEAQCSFYRADTSNVESLIDEVTRILQSSQKKFISTATWTCNTYQSRWAFILGHIMNAIK